MKTIVSWASVSTPFRDYLPAFMVHDVKCNDALRTWDKAEAARKRRDPGADLLYCNAWQERKNADDLLLEIMLFLVEHRHTAGIKGSLRAYSGRREARQAWLAVRAYGKLKFRRKTT